MQLVQLNCCHFVLFAFAEQLGENFLVRNEFRASTCEYFSDYNKPLGNRRCGMESYFLQERVNITTELLRNLRLIKIESCVRGNVSDFGFSRDGLLLASTSTEDTLTIYHCKSGNHHSVFTNKLYGTGRVVFNRDATCCLHSATKSGHGLHLLSIETTSYQGAYEGHTDKVTNLDISPVEDLVVSCSLDNTVRFWDFRVAGHVGKVDAAGKPAACFDPLGNILAVVFNTQTLLLFDIRSYGRNNLLRYPLPTQSDGWASVKFSPNGKFVLLSSFGRLLCQAVLKTGQVVHSITERANEETEALEAFYSPDGNFLISGTGDGHVCFFHQSNAVLASEVAHDTTFPVKRVQFNPKYCMLAASCSGMNFWIPQRCVKDSDEDDD
ncbi:hypothetical protein M513_03992 [Trichuris suis]|uniref:Uncharacterized protein n=1 Tax=Trichuris suis TaxID=68888 RepID=A0A085MCX8_9BILA|nr:hypothetical protein M513_03992 [Trichuris suis]